VCVCLTSPAFGSTGDPLRLPDLSVASARSWDKGVLRMLGFSHIHWAGFQVVSAALSSRLSPTASPVQDLSVTQPKTKMLCGVRG